VGYESGNDETLKRIKKGVTTDEMRRFTKSCHKAGVVIHGTFILGLPVETRETIEQTINFAKELDVFSHQVSLAAPYPGTELYDQARLNGWFTKKDKSDLVEGDGFQQSALEYPGLGKEQIFEALEEFYHRYYFSRFGKLLVPRRPSWRIFKSMLEDRDVFMRRAREGFEFFKSLAQRRDDLAAQRTAAASATAATA
jgi:radical SAM superfamily enzyme YgiQ (UPF0313 family)